VEGAVGAWLRSLGEGVTFPWRKLWCVALGVNCVLSMFPTFWSVTMVNFFKAKLIYNQTWTTVMLPLLIAYYYEPFKAFSFMMFGMGWSIAMFTVTSGRSPNFWKHGNVLALGSGVFFTALIPYLGSSAARTGIMSDYQVWFNLAAYFFGFMAWSTMEGYPHVHQWQISPDERLLAWKGPVAVEFPDSKQMPAKWGKA